MTANRRDTRVPTTSASTAQVPAAECQVAAAVAGIAAQGLAPVVLGLAGGVPVLLEVQAGEVQLVGAGHGGRRGGFGGRCLRGRLEGETGGLSQEGKGEIFHGRIFLGSGFQRATWTVTGWVRVNSRSAPGGMVSV